LFIIKDTFQLIFQNVSTFSAHPTDKISLFYGGPDECLGKKCGIDFLVLEYIAGKMGMKIK
jgi:hypothetical protein